MGLMVCCFLSMTTVVNAVPSLTLNQLTAMAVQNNNDLRAAKYNVALAKARLIQAGLWPNPSLNLANSDDRVFYNEGEYTRSVGFSQAFPISGRIAQQKKVARVDVAIAMAEIKDAERKLQGEVAANFYAVIITDRKLQQLKNLLTINQKLVQVTHNRFHVAEVSEMDTNMARLEYQRLLQEKRVLESIRINQIAQLNQLLGRSPTTSLSLNKSLPQPVQLPRVIDVQTLALQQRPDMRAIWLTLHRTQAERMLARAERWADWTVGLGVQQDKIAVEGAPSQKADRLLSLNVSIPLPLLNANQGRILETEAASTQALMKLHALKLAIQTEVAGNYARVQALQNVLYESQSSSLKLAARNVKLARDAYSHGQASLLEVVQAQRQHNDLQTIYLNTLDQHLQALVKLCTALGQGRRSKLCPYLANKGNLTIYACKTHSKP